jgi:hypothetical protein
MLVVPPGFLTILSLCHSKHMTLITCHDKGVNCLCLKGFYNLAMLEEPHFIGQPIEVAFDRPPLLEKRPGCPARFFWQGSTFEISEKISEWHDYRRRGRMARNMRPTHAAMAQKRGSWGVGRDYFRVRTSDGRLFEIYYDRAPKGADQRKGAWFLYRELPAEDD